METTQENTPTLALPPRDLMRENANALAKEINWFAKVVNQRLESVFPKESIPKPTPVVVEKKGFFGKRTVSEAIMQEEPIDSIKPPQVVNSPIFEESDTSIYADFVRHYQLTEEIGRAHV